MGINAQRVDPANGRLGITDSVWTSRPIQVSKLVAFLRSGFYQRFSVAQSALQTASMRRRGRQRR
jgi:hypothetical protein